MRQSGFPAMAVLFLMAGCASLPESCTATCPQTAPPRIGLCGDGATRRMQLDVLTYNVEGLSWPARSGRAPFLRQIGENLRALREAGNGPDIVLFQEMFSRSASGAAIDAGYPALAAGPSRTQRHTLARGGVVPGARSWKKGEIGMHFATGGLAIMSRYPIVAEVSEPFSKKSCAGFDCLSNKGMLYARIAIPGLPDPIELFGTHMNSQRSSKANVERRNAAHGAQANELREFVEEVGNDRYPAILAGDFNMRGSDERFGNFRPAPRLALVHRFCLEQGGCDIRLSWDGDAPWMDTQDLQFFSSGSSVTIRPIRVEAMFDGRPDSPLLSDHDGFRVVYELSWPAATSSGSDPCSALAWGRGPFSRPEETAGRESSRARR